ncbi:MAG TPA: hypothetical protein ACHBX0_00595 [Arsenophonus sp.]
MDITHITIYSLGKNIAWAEKKTYTINEVIRANQLLPNHEISKPLTERIERQGLVLFS